MSSEATVRVNQHLRVPLDSLVEFVICHLRLFDRDLVADDEAGLRLAGDDQVSEVSVVLLDVALAGCEFQSL
jgi:hypothetical protein